ncbi:MAG: hypothetical protein AAFV53_02885 [Myxococcota bacterium]
MTFPLLAISLLTGCADTSVGNLFLDSPYGAAVLDGGPFEDPIGFVANTRDGHIVPLNLKIGTYFSDNVASPFLQPRFVATGDERQLESLVAFSPNGDDVTVYAADQRFGVLVQAPYLTGVDPSPQLIAPTASEPVFLDNDSSGDNAEIEIIALRAGATTTEDWQIQYDGEQWWLFGSRSGKQGRPAQTNRNFRTDEGELEFLITGSATEGDRFELSTDTGLVEHDLGGRVLGLQRLPDSPWLLAGVWDADTEMGWISLFDMSQNAELGRIDLPDGAQPWRFAARADQPLRVFVSDARRSAAYQVDVVPWALDASEVVEIPTSAPIGAIAWAEDLDAGYSNLFVAPVGANRIDVYDLLGETWRDVNPYDGRDGGLNLYAAVVGMDATPETIPLQEFVEWGASTDESRQAVITKQVVVFTTVEGTIQMLEADNGCLARTSTVNRTFTSDNTEVQYASPSTPESTTLATGLGRGIDVQSPPCGGLLRDEEWTVTYDGAAGSWTVEGSRSGMQNNRAIEDTRYVSDEGALSFTLVSGDIPPVDGDAFSFITGDGALNINAYVRPSDNASIALDLPAEPVIFQYNAGQRGGGWDVLDRRTFALIPIQNSNFVLRIRLDTWTVEEIWD